jgi:SAM-dependent methyltransferase
VTPTACAGCGGPLRPRFREVVDPQTREVFALQTCQDCGLGHTTPRPAERGRYYGPAYHGGRHGLTEAYCLARRLKLVRRAAGAGPGRRLLDVGCGDGAFLVAARHRGWRVAGTELNPRPAREAGLEVRPSLEQALALGPFDCVTLWHSLEHLPDPLVSLRSLAGALAPGGVVVIAVPDAQGAQARIFGAAWFHLDVPRHLHHFGRASLQRLLERAGLRLERSWRPELEYDVMGFVQSALNTLLPTPNVLYDRLTGKPTRGGAAQVAASFVLGAALGAIAVPATVVSTVLGRAGTLVVSARAAVPRPS